MARWMVTLVGELRTPLYAPIRQPELRPDHLLLVSSPDTKGAAESVQRAATDLSPAPNTEILPVPAYDFHRATELMQSRLNAIPSSDSVVFNLTGGTKIMMLAAAELARQRNDEIIYVQSENQFCYQRFRYQDDHLQQIGTTSDLTPVTLHEYLCLHVGTYQTGEPRDPFEVAVNSALKESRRLDELMTSLRPGGQGALEVDFFFRIGTTLGVAEAKQSAAKSGIDQIQAVADPRYLGTYLRKFLISARPLDPNNTELAKAYRITTIVLPSFAEQQRLSDEDREKLVNTIVEAMQPRAR